MARGPGRDREHARLQLLLPAAALHVHARGPAELVRARRLRRHGDRRRQPRLALPDAAAPRPSSASARRLCSPTSPPSCSRGTGSRTSSARIEERTAAVLGVSSVQDRARRAPARRPRTRRRIRSTVEGRPVGALFTPETEEPALATRRRLLPALASLLAVALERETPGPRGARGRDAAPERHDQDRGDPGGVARPAHAARDDRAGARRPRERRARADATTTARRCSRRSASSTSVSSASSRTSSTSRASRPARRRRSPSSGPPTSSSRRRSRSSAARSASRVKPRTTCRRSRSTPPRSSARSSTCSRTRFGSRRRRAGPRPRDRDTQGRAHPRHRPRPGRARGRAGADLRAVPPGRRPTDEPRRRASGSRSRAASRRRTAVASGSSRARARAPRSCSRSRSSSCPRRSPRDGTRPRRRRRAAVPARAPDEPARRRVRGRDGDDGRGGAERRGAAPAGGDHPRPAPARRPRHRRLPASCGAGPTRRSSSSRPSARRRRRSPRSTPARTTT